MTSAHTAMTVFENRVLERALEDLERQTHALRSANRQVAQLESSPSTLVKLGFGELRRAGGRPSPLPPIIEKAEWASKDRDAIARGPLNAYPGHGSASLQMHRHVTMGYIIEGCDVGKIESFVQTVYAAQRLKQNFTPVFITFCARFEPYVSNNYIFEYIPPRDVFEAGVEAYEEWRRRRIAHIADKWGITDFVTYVSEAVTKAAPTSGRKPGVVVFPDYGDGNPYVGMMYAGMQDDFEIVFGTPQKAIERLRLGPVTFHLHWEDAVMRTLRDDAAPLAMADFVVAIDQLKALGGSFVWTIHNLEPHDAGDLELSLAFSRQLFLRADRIHVHDHLSATALRERYGADKDIVVIEHPSYRNCYPQKLDRVLARQSLDFEVTEDERLFLCFGQVRRYKGIATLMNVAPEYDGRAKFVIAGRAGRYDPRPAAPRNCIVIDGHIDDEKVSTLFSAADFAVLPFEEITASGSLLLALSFGIPVIAPAHGGVGNIVRDGREGFLYQPHADGPALSNAIQSALDAPQWQREAMEQSAAAAAAFRSPEEFALAVRRMFDQRPAAPATAPGDHAGHRDRLATSAKRYRTGKSAKATQPDDTTDLKDRGRRAKDRA